jgi:hypothetical protein
VSASSPPSSLPSFPSQSSSSYPSEDGENVV